MNDESTWVDNEPDDKKPDKEPATEGDDIDPCDGRPRTRRDHEEGHFGFSESTFYSAKGKEGGWCEPNPEKEGLPAEKYGLDVDGMGPPKEKMKELPPVGTKKHGGTTFAILS